MLYYRNVLLFEQYISYYPYIIYAIFTFNINIHYIHLNVFSSIVIIEVVYQKNNISVFVFKVFTNLHILIMSKTGSVETKYIIKILLKNWKITNVQ